MPPAPVFLGIEEYLGRNTQDYCQVLAEVGGGRWHPDRDAGDWIRFTLTAHPHQTRTLLRRAKESEQLWSRLETLVEDHGLNERSLIGLFDAALGLRIRSATYRAAFEEMGEDLTEGTATRDLRTMVEAGLLTARGEKRGRYYIGGRARPGGEEGTGAGSRSR